MALRLTPGPSARSDHLDALLAEVDALAERVAEANPGDRAVLAERRLDEAAVATLVLEGADADELPSLADAAVRAARTASVVLDDITIDDVAIDVDAERRGTWFDAMGVVHAPSDDLVRALEVLGSVAGLTADDLGAALTGAGAGPGPPADAAATPGDALRELHRRLTRGLVAEDRAGAPRSSDQAVHDASVGRIVYLPVPLERIPAEMEELAAWLGDRATSEHVVIASGALHAELLRIHPYEAANGRLARTAARLVLRAGGRDPDGLAAVEPVLAADPMGYHQAMADAIRRRDAGPWLERWAEAVAAGLRNSARALGMLPTEVPEHVERFLTGRPSRAFTLADYLDVVDRDRTTAARDLRALLDAGRIERRLGSRGLRFEITT